MILSIITITKNDPKGLLDTLASTKSLLLNSEFEQIVVDGSDSSIQTSNVKTITKQFPKVTYLKAQKEGRSNSFNQGLTHAKGDWVWFLNGGDRINSEFSTELLAIILDNSTSNAVIFEIIGKQSKQVRHHPPLWLRWPLIGNWIPHPATIIKKRIFTRLGGYSPKYNIAMDYDFWLRLLILKGSVDTLSIPLTVYDETGISSKNVAQVSRENIKCFFRHSTTLIKIYFSALRYNLRTLYFFLINALTKKQ